MPEEQPFGDIKESIKRVAGALREAEVPFLDVFESGAMPEVVVDRLARAAAPRTFNRGVAAAGDWREYTHVMKLDGDIELKPTYFSDLMARFAADPSLGLAGGVLDEPVEGGGGPSSLEGCGRGFEAGGPVVDDSGGEQGGGGVTVVELKD